MALAASTSMTGRQWIFWVPTAGIGIIGLSFLYCHTQGMITPNQYAPIIETAVWTFGLLCIFGTILAFYFAYRKYLISIRTISLALLGWLTLCVLAGYTLWRLYVILLEER